MPNALTNLKSILIFLPHFNMYRILRERSFITGRRGLGILDLGFQKKKIQPSYHGAQKITTPPPTSLQVGVSDFPPFEKVWRH